MTGHWTSTDRNAHKTLAIFRDDCDNGDLNPFTNLNSIPSCIWPHNLSIWILWVQLCVHWSWAIWHSLNWMNGVWWIEWIGLIVALFFELSGRFEFDEPIVEPRFVFGWVFLATLTAVSGDAVQWISFVSSQLSPPIPLKHSTQPHIHSVESSARKHFTLANDDTHETARHCLQLVVYHMVRWSMGICVPK